VAFFDETGRREVLKIKHTQFRRIFRVVITREDLGWVGARIAVLSVLDPNLSKSFPWHISIDDLRVVAALFASDEVRFVHYLEQRLTASAVANLIQHDEVDHVGLYTKINYYHELPVEGMDQMSFDASYTVDIDHYFMERSAGDEPPVPTQDMPRKIREFVQALRDSRLPKRFEVGSVVLSLDGEAREELQKGLNTLDASLSEGKQRTIRVPFTSSEQGLSVTYADDTHWEEELKRSAVQMEQGKFNQWLVVQMTHRSPYEVSKIEVILPGRFSDGELATERARFENRVQRTIASEKTGPNEKCPCGSGKKFKKCHGKNA
jgi:hypothetical protein